MKSLLEILSKLVRQRSKEGMRRITIKGKIPLRGRIYEVSEVTKKTGLIICHGIGLFQRLYAPLAEYLSKNGGFRVMTFNFRGHGRKQVAKLTLAGALEDVKNAVKHMVKEEGHEKVILVGHSIGAVVALKLVADSHPDCVSAIVMIGSPTELSSLPVRFTIITTLAKLISHVDISEMQEELEDYDPSKEVGKLEKDFPVFVGYGQLDEVVKVLFRQKPEDLEKFTSSEQLESRFFPKMMHAPYIKEEAKKEILEWIEEHSD